MSKYIIFITLLSLSYFVSGQKDKTIYSFVDKDAVYYSGIEELVFYINHSIIYPEKALRNSIQGTVYITFVVEKDGSISKVKYYSGPKQLKKEAIRILKKMPNWIPGEINGEIVRTKCRLPINFVLH